MVDGQSSPWRVYIHENIGRKKYNLVGEKQMNSQCWMHKEWKVLGKRVNTLKTHPTNSKRFFEKEKKWNYLNQE